MNSGNEFDAVGVEAFVVQSVLSGSLTIGGQPYSVSNNVINATTSASWLPDADVSGTVQAFTVRARDYVSLLSDSDPGTAGVQNTPIPVPVS